MKTYDVYLFDLDGTLTNTAPVWVEIFKDGLADHGITNISEQIIAQHTHDWRAVLELGLPEEKLTDFITLAYRRASLRLPKAPLCTGALPMLERLKHAGKQTGVFTTMDRPILEPVMEFHSALAGLLDVIVAGTDVPRRKPHPDGIHYALGKLGVVQDGHAAVAYFGDKDTDIFTAQNAGVDGVLYLPSGHSEMYDLDTLRTISASAIIESWDEVLPATAA